MSLAMFAAPFNDNHIENMSNNTDNLINKKRQTHNKTQKIFTKENFDSNKVNSVLEKIHNNSSADDDEDNSSNLENFNPPPKPQSAGVNKTIATENMMNMNNNSQTNFMLNTLGHPPQPVYSTNNLELNDYSNYGNDKTNAEYYKRVIPGYKNQMNKLYYNLQNNRSETHNEDILLQKLNYMISLLEEQQDEKTNNVTEEIILYSFLGIFIIFIVDSFARVGKYVR